MVSSSLFHVPFLRQIYSWAGSLPVDKGTFLSRLNAGKAVAFCPGGVQESLMLDPKKPRDLALYLRNRKGFIKLALQTGSPIVPVFGFHLDGTFGYWFPRGAWIERLSRAIGFLPLFYWGRFRIPFGIPYPKKLTIVVGSPIDIPKTDEVTSEKIDEYHKLFVDELMKLFDRHKHSEGYGTKRLKIA
mmetsp:Transcript_2714/g.3867  ORF Transcript_2714/g.3867 Transcript_2714/m.3867 type:complete len:187 (-) Transcript_2714:323-883(-)